MLVGEPVSSVMYAHQQLLYRRRLYYLPNLYLNNAYVINVMIIL